MTTNNKRNLSVPKHLWKYANSRLIPTGLFCVIGAIIASLHGGIQKGSINHKIFSSVGIIIFLLAASAFLHILTKIIFMILTTHGLSVGRSAVIKFVLRLIGYAGIFLITLELLGIPIEKLVLGGAVVGIILGVAAQQALANFFASIVLIFSHPFSVGEDIVLFSGALGGKYSGRVIDLGLTHTKIKDDDGNIVFMPNATLLSGAAIMAKKHEQKTEQSKA
jgi:small-conductance mechanosensitive channel